jgi:NADH:ubiquinone oxidoreductase subunit 3 (subunit A)
MTLRDVLLSPPAAGCIFLALACGLYRLGGLLAAGGEEHADKYQPYACGEDLLPPEAQLTYHAFFQLALMFSLLHLATLVVSTLPQERASQRVALIYLLGIVASVFVLMKDEEA